MVGLAEGSCCGFAVGPRLLSGNQSGVGADEPAMETSTAGAGLPVDETLRSLEQKSAQLRAVGQISAALAAAWELEDTLDVITRITSEVMGVDSSSIALGRGIAGQVAASGQPVIVPDVHADNRYLSRALADVEGWVSVLSVPLVVRDRVVGVFGCFTGSHHDFTPKEVELFQTLANQTALAIENAQLVINRAVVREMHHRIKNNLQSIAMLLRLQMSAAGTLRAEDVLAETANRILSIAAVHETLSEQGLRVVDVKSVIERVTRSIGEMMPAGGRGIAIAVTGDGLVLPSREATSLALATSELVQNAVKHAFAGRDGGRINVQLHFGVGESEVVVEDDGVGAAQPPASPGGIGLQLVETLVHEDLKGRFDSTASPAGTRSVIRFPGAAAAGAKT